MEHEALYTAIREFKGETVRQLIGISNFDIDYAPAQCDQLTFLMKAVTIEPYVIEAGTRRYDIDAAANQHEIVKALLEKRCEINKKDIHQRTALSYAAENGLTEIVALLIDEGADKSAMSDCSNTPLCFAAMRGHTATVKLLIKKGASMERTLLIKAASPGRYDTVNALLDKGYKINTTDTLRRTALSYAAHNGHKEVVELLINKEADINTMSDSGKTPLCFAAMRGHTKTVQRLIETGAEIETKDEDDKTPLFHAVENGHTATVKLLLTEGAKTKVTDKRNKTLIFYAISKGHTAIVDCLLNHSLDSKDSMYDYDALLAINAEHNQRDPESVTQSIQRFQSTSQGIKLKEHEAQRIHQTSVIGKWAQAFGDSFSALQDTVARKEFEVKERLNRSTSPFKR